jgi:hypothetical protein
MPGTVARSPHTGITAGSLACTQAWLNFKAIGLTKTGKDELDVPNGSPVLALNPSQDIK